MKETDILAALGDVDDRWIAEAAPSGRKQRIWHRLAAAAACLALIVTGGVWALRQPAAVDPPIVLSARSSGVSVRYTENPRSVLREACLVWLELDEIFTPETTIFRGKVSAIDNIVLDFNGRKSYRAIARVTVSEALQGEVSPGELVPILLPCPITGEVRQSATDIIAQLRVGMEGIFMPKAYDEDAFWEENGATLYLRDIAAYGLWDGMRWVFLDTDAELVFAKSVYEEIAATDTLDQVEDYIRRQLG